MLNFFRTMIRELTSFGFAVTVISILFGASVAGWVLTEVIPLDFIARKELYAERWGEGTTRLMELLKLYDPFHSLWYRAVLALFFIVLLLCLCARWKRFVMRSFRIEPPGGMGDLSTKGPRFDVEWNEIVIGEHTRDPLSVLEKRYGRRLQIDGELIGRLYERVRALLTRKGYHVVSAGGDEGMFFAAVAGRWRFLGSLLFHTGILVIAAGGMIGSFWGSAEFVTGKPGDVLPIGGSPYSLLIEDFRIIMTSRMEVKDYVTRASVFNQSGDTLLAAEFEVNRPLTFEGYRIYQSQYFVDETEFKWARIEVVVKEDFRKILVTLKPGDDVAVEGTGLSIKPKRFFPDFRIDAQGPFSASASMSNPALEVEVASETELRRGWLFLYNPRFNTKFTVPVLLSLIEIEPVFHTGLQVSTNPGATTLQSGIAVATIGLLLLYLVHYRLIRGLVGKERLVISGAGYKWKVSFTEELEELEVLFTRELRDILGGDSTK